MFQHAAGRLTPDEADYVPAIERHKVYRTARIHLAIYAVTIGLAVGFRTWLPVVLIGGPRLYGALLLYFYSFTQHAGMGENVLDYRLNTRTVKMCRLNRFLYWNMNYHVEHHMFPLVPYHNLPKLMANMRRSGNGRSADPGSQRFDDWLEEVLIRAEPAARDDALIAWAKAPAAREAHPREEHFLPLHVVVGAAGNDPGRRALKDVVMGAVESAFRFG